MTKYDGFNYDRDKPNGQGVSPTINGINRPRMEAEAYSRLVSSNDMRSGIPFGRRDSRVPLGGRLAMLPHRVLRYAKYTAQREFVLWNHY